MSHIFRNDRRISVIKQLIAPFQLQFQKIVESSDKNGGAYWDSIYADDAEHFVGTVFIVLQNYINSSISDLYPQLEKVYPKYAIGQTIDNSQSTPIQLIISVANFYKHRDLPSELNKYTAVTLKDLGIDYKSYFNDQNDEYFHEVGSNSPVFAGLTILSTSWDFMELIDIVSEWRENMWQMEEN